MTNWDNEKYWSKSGTSFNLDDDSKPKYKFDDISKYSSRSRKPAQQPIQMSETPKSAPVNAGCSISILSESDLECTQLTCVYCGKLITEDSMVCYEGQKIFTDEICWKHWIEEMVKLDNFQVKNLMSHKAKRYFLDCTCLTLNGQLITKAVLTLKSDLGEFEFGSMIFDNIVAYNHYMSFLRETRQTDEKLMRLRNMIDEPMKNLREIMNDNSDVTAATIGQYIRQLIEIRDEIKLNNVSLSFQWDIVGEYAQLLEWQAKNCPNMINQPFIATVIAANLSHKAITDTVMIKFLKDTFKTTPEEFFWTCLKQIVLYGKVADIDKALNQKGFGSRPDVSYERIVSYLYSLNKESDELKMRCLLKISNINDLVDCARLYHLLEHFKEFCKQNKESSTLKKINQILQDR